MPGAEQRGRVYRSEHALRTASDQAPAGMDAGAAAETGTPAGSDPPDEYGNVAGHSAVMAIGSIVSRLTGFLRVVIIAAALGSTLVGDAYTTAQFFPNMIYELLLGGILTSVLVPVLVRARKADPDRGEAYTHRLLSLAVLALGAATVLAVLAAPLLALVWREPDSRGMVIALSYLILPTIFFYGMAGILTAILNTRGHFAAPMWVPILNNMVVIATFVLYLLIFGPEPPTAGDMTAGKIALAGGGTLLGIVVQASGLLPALRRVGFTFRWRTDFAALRLGELGRLGGWMFCYVAFNQVGVLVVMAVLSTARAQGEDGLLIFNQTYLLMAMAHGIVAVSVIMALMPRMSAASADLRQADLVADLSRGARTITAVLAPVVVVYVVLAAPITVALFQRGAFLPEHAEAMVPVLVVAGLALIPFSLSQLTTFAFYAMPDTRTPALVNIGVVALRVVVQVGLFAVLTASLAAAAMFIGFGVSFVVAAVVMAWLLRRRLGPLGLRVVGQSMGRVALATGGAAVAGMITLRMLPGSTSLTSGEAWLQLVVGGVVVGGAYVGLAMLLRIGEIHDVINLVRRKVLRR
jgi:putative peptidoglycan lipid II flippase